LTRQTSGVYIHLYVEGWQIATSGQTSPLQGESHEEDTRQKYLENSNKSQGSENTCQLPV